MLKLFLTIFLSLISITSQAQTVLNKLVPPDVSKSKLISHTSLTTMSLDIILSAQNQTQLTTFIKNLHDPHHPLYHHWLKKGEFSKSYGALGSDISAVESYLKSQGFTIAKESSNKYMIKVSGPVSAIENAFKLKINNYQRTDGTTFYSTDSNPTIDASISGKVSGIIGLDNAVKIIPHLSPVSNVTIVAHGSGHSGNLSPGDILTLYNMNSVPSNGAGQSVALVEFDDYLTTDITSYESYYSLPNVTLNNTCIDVSCPTTGGDLTAEVAVDIEAVIGSAPGISSVNVYESPDSNWDGVWDKIASDDSASLVSCSWGIAEVYHEYTSFDNTLFAQLQSQGQAVFVASGDKGAEDGSGELSVDEPSAQPVATGTGMSTASSSGGIWTSETADSGSGGGISQNWTIPSYQTTVAAAANGAADVSTTYRNVPDLDLSTSSSSTWDFVYKGSWEGYSGTSISAPWYAGFFARVNQGLGSKAPLGPPNSAVYNLADNATSYANDFHDITTGNNKYSGGSGYDAEVGYDLASGLGSLNGLNLYNDLVGTTSVTSVVRNATIRNATFK